MSTREFLDPIFTDEERSFRKEVREFIAVALPDDIRRKMADRAELTDGDIRRWQRILNGRGWATPSWPSEWGGPGWSAVQRYIFLDELYRAPAPEPLTFNVNMIGPLLIAFGTEDQKQRFLSRIANIDDWWCQGFSEPGSGSDLASLKTSARRDGDVYVVNGQKIWTTMAHYADWMFCLVRTSIGERKQDGISILMIDMRTPGIEVRPIVYMDGRHESNEVFFTEVRVPKENLVGSEGKGWSCAKYLLTHERVGIARIGASKQRIERAKELAGQTTFQGRRLADTPRFRERIAAIEVELVALEMTQLRVLSAQQRQSAHKADPASSILKIKGSELQQAAAELLLDVAGCHGVREVPEAEANRLPDWDVLAAQNYFFSRAFSIYGGANEIQKNIVAASVLGL